MTRLFKTLAAGAAVALLGAGMASAATVNATSVTVGSTTVTTATNTTSRFDAGNALGASNATQSGNVFTGMYSLGVGGVAEFGFGTNFRAPGILFEVTSGSRSSFPESARVEALNVLSGLWDNLGSITNAGPTQLVLQVSLDLIPGSVYSALRLTDTSGPNSGFGMEVDAISVSAVPLPAGGLLLIGALGGLGLAARRRRA